MEEGKEREEKEQEHIEKDVVTMSWGIGSRSMGTRKSRREIICWFIKKVCV